VKWSTRGHPPAGIDRRRAERVKLRTRVTLRLDNPLTEGRIARPAETRDLSLLGARIATRHLVRPGQRMDVVIPTRGAPAEFALPDRLCGQAVVERVEQKNGIREAALRFGPALAQSMEYAMFIAYRLGARPEPSPTY